MHLGETERLGQALEEAGANILVGRLSVPDDVAGLAVFLASSAADYLTGQAINVDGGIVFHGQGTARPGRQSPARRPSGPTAAS